MKHQDMSLTRHWTPLLMAFCVGMASCSLTDGGLDEGTGSPVEKVVVLLKQMKKEIEADAEEDQASYDKYMCWCQTTMKGLEEGITTSSSTIKKLEAYLVEAAGLAAELHIKLTTYKEEEKPSDEEALNTASSQREKDKAAFDKEAADLKAAIDALREAIAVLSKVQLLQKQGLPPSAITKQVRPALLQLDRLARREGSPFEKFRDVMQKDLFDALNSLGGDASSKAGFLEKDALLPWEKTEEQKGMEANPNALEGNAAGAKSYNSRSGQILGILKEMLDEFLTDLAQIQKAELEALVSFQKLKGAKSKELEVDISMIKDFELRLATCTKGISDAKVELKDTKGKLSEDQKLLAEVKKMCAEAEAEYAARVKARNEELDAINETIKFLTSDEARDLFQSTLSFMQTASVKSVMVVDSAAEARQKRRMRKAVWKIVSVAKRNGNMALAAMAAGTNLDSFEKVKIMMDKMIAELAAQQKAEYEKHESCEGEIDHTEDAIKEAEYSKKKLEEKKLHLENLISTLATDIQALNDEVAELEQAMKHAGEERKGENMVFQKAVSDQRATTAILKKASERLAMYYNSKASALQQKTDGASKYEPPPEKTFAGKYEKSGGAGGVEQMLAKIISDSEQTEAALVNDEQHDQAAYAAFAASTTETIETDRHLVVEKEAATAAAHGELSETEEALLFTEGELEKHGDLLRGLHAECDYLIKYFSIRQAARAEEMDTIKEAKAILSGADFGSS